MESLENFSCMCAATLVNRRMWHMHVFSNIGAAHEAHCARHKHKHQLKHERKRNRKSKRTFSSLSVTALRRFESGRASFQSL